MGDMVSCLSELVLFARPVLRFQFLLHTLVFVFVVAIPLLCEELPGCPMTGIKAVGGIPAKGGSPVVPFGMCQLPGFSGALCRFAGAGPRPFGAALDGALRPFITSNCFEKCRDEWRRIRPRFQVRDHRARPVEAPLQTREIVRSILCGTRATCRASPWLSSCGSFPFFSKGPPLSSQSLRIDLFFSCLHGRF